MQKLAKNASPSSLKFRSLILGYVFQFMVTGLIYSMSTSLLIVGNLGNKYLILFADCLVNIILFLIIARIKLSPARVNLINGLGLAFAFICIWLPMNILPSILVFYSLATLILSLNMRQRENILVHLDTQNGMTNISLMQTLAQLLGFVIGTFINQNTFWLVIVFLILSFGGNFFWDNHKCILKSPVHTQHRLPIKLNWDWVILMMLSSTAVFWIPSFVSKLSEAGYSNLLFLPFALPGLFTLIMLSFSRKYELTYLVYVYCPLIIIFWVSLHFNVWLSITLFSVLVSFSVTLAARTKRHLLKHSIEENRQLVLQMFELVSVLLTFLFSFLALFFSWIPFVLLSLDLIATFILMFKKKGIFI